MNAAAAASNSPTEFIQDNASESDSDTNTDDSPAYYQPITTIPGEEEDSDADDNLSDHHHALSNGHTYCLQNGVSSLDLSDNEDEEEMKEEDEEEERMREAAIRRAIRQDERRRNAPLAPENAARVMEAMRRVSFAGFEPNWADRVPEDRWVGELRRLREGPPSAARPRE